MARRTAARGTGAADGTRLRICEEGLEWEAATPAEVSVIRTMMGRVNGPSYPQPYLVEGPPGHFRLYVGDAAERARTARGIA
ncbi:MAG: hypothetical protein U0807_18570 [Candidatus Binatia bacterium]